MGSLKSYVVQKINNPLLKTGLIYIITDSINNAIPFLLLPIILKFLSPAEYGIVANFTILIAILMVGVSISMEGAISTNFFKMSKEDLSKYIMGTLMIITSSFFFFFFLLFFFNNIIFSYTKIPIKYQYCALIICYFQSIIQINLTLWRLESKALKFGIFQIFQTLVNLGLSIYFIALLNIGWIGRAEGIFSAAILFGPLSIFVLWKRNYITLDYNNNFIKDALLFGLPLLPHSLSMWIRSGIDRVFITKYLGEAANGLFATGFQFGILMTFITVAFNNTFIPYLFKQLSTEDEKQLEIIKIKLVKMSYGIMLGLIGLCLVLTILSLLIIHFFLPTSYALASKFVFWAILAQTFQGMYFVVGNYIFYAKKTKIFSLITFSCSLVQIVISFYLIRKVGILGAAYSSAFISLLNFIAVWFYSNKVYKMPWFNLNKY